jgi:ATP-dependent Clp protease ATP-binding subunit ClpX
MDNVDLQFTEDAIEAIADTAIKHKTGARGLRSIVEKLLLDIMFEVPSIKEPKKLVITKEIVENQKKATIDLLEDGKQAS